MPLELTAADSSRQLLEQLRAERIQQLRFDRAEFDRQRIDQQRTEAARSSRELAEQAAIESFQNEFQSNRVAPHERVRNDDVLAERQTDRFLTERARVEAPLAYAAQAPRVENLAQADRLQAERIQTTRDSIERADATRIDRIVLSDQAIGQVQFAY